MKKGRLVMSSDTVSRLAAPVFSNQRPPRLPFRYVVRERFRRTRQGIASTSAKGCRAFVAGAIRLRKVLFTVASVPFIPFVYAVHMVPLLIAEAYRIGVEKKVRDRRTKLFKAIDTHLKSVTDMRVAVAAAHDDLYNHQEKIGGLRHALTTQKTAD
jgi:hypothetical protein